MENMGYLGQFLSTVGVSIILLALVIIVASYVLTGLSLSTVAKAEGKEKEGKLAWIPIFNTVLLFNLGEGNYFMLFCLFLSFIPILGNIFSIVYSIYTLVIQYRIYSRYNLEGLYITTIVLSFVGSLLLVIGFLTFARFIIVIGLLTFVSACVTDFIVRIKLYLNAKARISNKI